jgi:signal transduction histidine kinase
MVMKNGGVKSRPARPAGSKTGTRKTFAARSSSPKGPDHPYQEILSKLTAIFQSALDPKVVLQLVLQDLVNIFNATSGSVVLVNPETGLLEIEASVELSEQGRRLSLRVGEGITGWVAFHGKPARVGDVRRDPRYVAARSNIRSELAVPLLHGQPPSSSPDTNNLERGEEHILGVLNLDSSRVNAFSASDEELLINLAAQISPLILNAWLYHQAREGAQRLNALLALGQKLMTIETLPELLLPIAQGACKVVPVTLCLVMLVDPQGQNLLWKASSRPLPLDMGDYAMPIDNSQIGMVVRRRKPITAQDIQKADPFPFSTIPELRHLVSLLAVPLISGSEVLGVLAFITEKPHLFSKEEIQTAMAAADHAALALHRCRLTEKLNTTEEAMRESERLSAIGLLATEVAHEIRNPLTVIKMLIHNLHREGGENDPRQRDFEVITRKMDQMNRTVEQVLNLGRNSEPILVETGLNSVVEELALLIRQKIAHQNIALTLLLSSEGPKARMDRAQIEQALLNLILNAIQAMSEGGHLEVRTGNTATEKDVWIEIADSGPGMPEFMRENLFQPFLTSKPTGTGLGMAIVSKIIKAHDGRIEVSSEPAKGTTIRVTLPAA